MSEYIIWYHWDNQPYPGDHMDLIFAASAEDARRIAADRLASLPGGRDVRIVKVERVIDTSFDTIP